MIQTNVQLARLTTLKVGGAAAYLADVHTEAELIEAVAYANEHHLPVRVLGGGSNVLVPDEGFAGLVIKNSIMGREHTVSGDAVTLTVGAGEVLDEVVAYTVEHGWWGLENLSHIPGSVGATPVQNVGAYGVEVKDLISTVRVFDTSTGAFTDLHNADCAFGYRDSIFKHAEGEHYIVTAVTFVLSLKPRPQLSYKDLAERFSDTDSPSLTAVRDAIIAIRSKKFPNWHEVGTAGSFFKNPMVAQEQYATLKEKYPELPGFPTADGTVKIPLGWVLDKVCALKGVTAGNVGTFAGQALVLINHGGATAKEISDFASSITTRVKDELGVEVEWEVTRW